MVKFIELKALCSTLRTIIGLHMVLIESRGVFQAGEIWPRSYDSSNELTFDENGAAFPLHERPTLSRILRRSRISSLNANTAYKDSYNYNSFYNNFS
ncbi:hypothetical protein TELCIR_14783 [Teladorsagia circumcincta]|uniref:Uncharacterized protein n=1 Tax=Teladorsagia circumcincta TaxID=45464 RepID=A0A2G9U1N1_TELCI|nr:hypothetical protein TELCIR_14783 [Teladorsagia circumcincta]